jgi:shikimate dehydrogenase
VADPERRAAVLGRPIAHSLSPALHHAAYAALGLNWSYEAIDCGTDELAAVLADRTDWAGFSCTMPLKRAVLELADEVRPLAAAVGAANTLLPRPDGGWIAENTDVAGIVETVRGAGRLPQSVTVLGAGGTAQAVVGALAALGLAHCTALVRDPARTAELRAAAEVLGVTVTVDTLVGDAPALRADLVVSTLPGAAADPLAAHPWTPGQIVLDVVYDPWPTALAAAAQAARATVLSGARMLLHQAAAQVELMTGRPAPIEAMADALRRSLES